MFAQKKPQLTIQMLKQLNIVCEDPEMQSYQKILGYLTQARQQLQTASHPQALASQLCRQLEYELWEDGKVPESLITLYYQMMHHCKTYRAVGISALLTPFWFRGL
ncbi:hypothetical protein CBF34_09110 [Vagococcus penaei]|uniref:Uncharacterized protein n=1 Tax=Vagococcus penaei TaxID=633807 RepID=A0A1Q2D5N3_9ENTE|nr:bacteriocin immunity protein [Vagococcus penaei]AQP53708.1 hypothetical protein BW732_05280 [Vagococcus penaei]RST99456.1 hypothetical protein CBF34_09110 [Vagococcus penaei]